MPKIFGNRFYVFLILIASIIFIIFLNLIGILPPLNNLARKVFSPINKGASSVGKKIGGFFDFFKQIKNLSKENKNLEEKVKNLLVDNVKLKKIEKENEILREQLDYQKYSEHKLLPAFIFGFNPNNLLQTINLNRGEKDGVKKGMAIVVLKGVLVGQIKEANYSDSSGLLITDGNSVIPAKILDSEADGIVKGEHGLGLIIDMIPQDKIIKKGDIVITSDLGGKLPKDFVIGEIEEILSSENELFQKARIKSPVNFKELESVYVVIE